MSLFDKREDRALERIADELSAISGLLRKLLNFLSRHAVSAKLKFRTSKGEVMDLTAHVNDVPGTAVFTEFDGPNGTGNKVPPVGAVSFVSSDPSVATVDASSGALVYLKAGQTSISASDAGNSLSAAATLTLI